MEKPRGLGRFGSEKYPYTLPAAALFLSFFFQLIGSLYVRGAVLFPKLRF